MSQRPGQAFVLSSLTGEVWKVNSPIVAEVATLVAKHHELLKAATEPGAAQDSQRLKDPIGTAVQSVACGQRPFDMPLFAYATTLNTYHRRAITAKVQDICGRGWEIVGEGAGEGARRVLADWLAASFEGRTFEDGIGEVWTDYESLGNGYLEVIPDAKGVPAAFAPVTAVDMWVRLDGLGFVQHRAGRYAHFRRFGLDLDRYAALPAADPLHPLQARNAVIHFRNYSPWSEYYGLPDILTAWPSLALMTLEREYNLQFFGNNAIPDYAVILEGEWGDDAVETIKTYFKQHLKGQAHKTLALEAPNGCKVTFQKLTSDTAKEAGFRLLRQDCRDEILNAHGVPPQIVGLVETGKLGGNLSTEQRQSYRDSIVMPGQRKIATALNQVLALRTAGDRLSLQFAPYSADDRRLQADIDQIYLQNDVLVPNEVRQERYPQLPPLPGGDEPLSATRAAAGPPLEDMLSQFQRTLRDEVAKVATEGQWQ